MIINVMGVHLIIDMVAAYGWYPKQLCANIISGGVPITAESPLPHPNRAEAGRGFAGNVNLSIRLRWMAKVAGV